jgi:hypothetical protein
MESPITEAVAPPCTYIMIPAASRVEASPAPVFMWVMLCPGFGASADAGKRLETRNSEIKMDVTIERRRIIALLN